jgi:hypothetical protein
MRALDDDDDYGEYVVLQCEERDREELQALWREEVQTRRRERAPIFPTSYAKRFGGDVGKRG